MEILKDFIYAPNVFVNFILIKCHIGKIIFSPEFLKSNIGTSE